MPKVCLDAGHFGRYNQSPVVPAYYESERMWQLHLYLKSELEALGIQVVQTRPFQGADLELTARGRKAKGCDLFLSLHSNAPNATGLESIDYPVAYVMRDGSTNAIGYHLAQTVERVMQTRQNAQTSSLASSNDRDGNGKKDDEYYGVLQGCKMVGVPGLILEHSFHTNTRAAQWLMSDDNLRTLAKSEAAVLGEYFGLDPVPSAPDWKADAMAWAKSMGLMNGERPDDPITRAETAQVFKNAYVAGLLAGKD